MLVESNVRERLIRRSEMHHRVRAFFIEKGSLEVDVPMLSPFASVDAFIDPFVMKGDALMYLHTSPEYAMKRILAEGSGDIFSLGHVFRREEEGSRHSSEFTMVEWYKIETNEHEFIEEVCDFIALFLGPMSHETISYQKAFAKGSNEDLSTLSAEDRHYSWATKIEPMFPTDRITIVTDFLPDDAANAKLHETDEGIVARRFEFYVGEIELANAFDELTASEDQLSRLKAENAKRRSLGKEELSIDPYYIKALEKGIPPNTYGVAAGFDRLLMLQQNVSDIKETLCLS